MGMQQVAKSAGRAVPHAVMIEIVGYRSPESDALMDKIQRRVLDRNKYANLGAMLHWGLETDQMLDTDIPFTPLQAPIAKNKMPKIDAFRAVRQYLAKNKKFNPFDNVFTSRLKL